MSASKTCAPMCLSCAAVRAGIFGDDASWSHDGSESGAQAAAIRLVDLHAPTRAAHDYLCGDDRFERTLELIRSSEGCAVSTWIARPNFRELGEMPALLKELGVSEWRLRLVRSPAEGSWDRLVPRVALAMPHALRAAARAQKLGIECKVEGAPLCVLGPMRDLAVRTGAESTFPDKCAPCALRGDCEGIAPRYAEAFGDEDLRTQAS